MAKKTATWKTSVATAVATTEMPDEDREDRRPDQEIEQPEGDRRFDDRQPARGRDPGRIQTVSPSAMNAMANDTMVRRMSARRPGRQEARTCHCAR